MGSSAELNFPGERSRGDDVTEEEIRVGDLSFVEALRMFWPLLLLQLVLAIVALVDLARRREVRHLPKPAWVIVVVLLQTLGPILYLALGRGDE